MPKSDDHSAVFISGYEKGKADAFALAQSFFEVAFERYPAEASRAAYGFVPVEFGKWLAGRIKQLGDAQYRAGRRDEKKKHAATET